MIFGNENGEQDALLDDCSVDISSSTHEHRIFAGRWGSGKSAQLFIANKVLRQFLKSKKAEDNSLWYIGENSLAHLPQLKN